MERGLLAGSCATQEVVFWVSTSSYGGPAKHFYAAGSGKIVERCRAKKRPVAKERHCKENCKVMD